MTHQRRTVGAAVLALALSAALTVSSPAASAAPERTGPHRPRVTEVATIVDGPCTDDICSLGSAVGPDGALYVTDGSGGRIRRVDRRRGTVTTYADGLPPAIPGVVGGGLTDVAFLRGNPYVLVTGVSEFWTTLVGSTVAPATEGIYRLDRVGAGTTRATLVADLYTWSEAHPPDIDRNQIFVPGGYTYAMEPYGDGFLVTDGHHNRVLRVTRTGRISTFTDFGANIVPTGLARTHGRRGVLVGQAGPTPHTPETGRVVAVRRPGDLGVQLANGAPLLVDVEVGPRQRLYGLAQGDWPYEGQEGKEGFPAAPNTGELMVANRHGRFRDVVTGLDRPTSFEIVGHTAYVVTITGKVLRVGLGGR